MFNIQNRILVGIMLSVIAMLTALSILAFVQNQSFSDSIIVGDVEYDTHTPNYSTNIVFSDNLRNGGWMTMSARLMQSDFIDTEKVNGVDFNAEILLQDGTVVTSSSDHFSGRADGSSVQLAGNARIEVEDTHTVSSDSIRYDEASRVIATESLTFLRFPGGIATVGKLIANFPDDDSDNGTEYDLSEGVNIVLYRE
ncbi:MAG: hypothetical protein OXC91_01805 [Rhodobacteraceae bacterium]|nr:hypothetical protein [Paracoccaceae bacterium]